MTLKNKPENAAREAGHTTDELWIDVHPRNLSDRSTVYSVMIREAGSVPFVELDCIDQRCADNLCKAIRFAVAQNTNIKLG